jgi:hypothetical protein
MGIVTDWRAKLKLLKEAPFPEYEQPSVHNTIGGINTPSTIESPEVPVIDADSDHNNCIIDCDALKELLNWAGADQSQGDTVIEKIKGISKQFGVVTTEHLNDIMAAATQDEPQTGPRSLGISSVTPISANGPLSGRSMRFQENLETVMNNEEVEVIKKKKEK